jgi:hypothetical protein
MLVVGIDVGAEVHHVAVVDQSEAVVIPASIDAKLPSANSLGLVHCCDCERGVR